MNKDEFIDEIKKIYKNIPVNFFAQIEKYKAFLIQENKKYNLTNFANEQKIYSDYFLASIYPYQNLDFKQYKSILDIGSGSGIPGVVLKLLFPTIELTIIEANNKKCNFLNMLKKILNIEFVIKNKRAEQIKKDEREKYDLVTSRAVSQLKILIEISIPYLKINGLLIEPKSVNADIEIANSKIILKEIGAELIKVEEISQKTNSFKHIVVYITKTKKTVLKFPREWNKIIK